jgi:hypothetical protein
VRTFSIKVAYCLEANFLTKLGIMPFRSEQAIYMQLVHLGDFCVSIHPPTLIYEFNYINKELNFI